MTRLANPLVNPSKSDAVVPTTIPVGVAVPALLQRFRRRCRIALLLSAGMAIMTVGSLIMLVVAVVTLLQARRFYSEIARWMGWLGLWMAGVRLVVHHDEPLPQAQTIYVSNHTSSLDVFVLISLGLPNTRFFLSGYLRKILPLGMIGYLIGIFWTVPQQFPARRQKIFQRAERILRRTGESVYLSPEGRRVTTGNIGPFNKGAFHLATNLRAPIVPFYIDTPKEIDPGLGLEFQPGVVNIYFKPAISTQDWRLEDLEANRTKVRNFFVALHNELHGGKP
jgi:1-acyl-sn-glycerol-3-phosphate acyltransferase